MHREKLQNISVGQNGEDIAAHFLENQGMRLLEKNFKCKAGEIDLVMQHHLSLVFIEVKTRSSKNYGHPLEFITRSKQRKVINAALLYTQQKKMNKTPLRFDAVGILLAPPEAPHIEWIESAFTID